MKRLCLSLGISLIVDIIGTLINYFGFRNSGHLPLGFKTWGGECLSESGFGMRVFHVYAMTPDGQSSAKVWFSIIDFLIWLLAIAAIIWLMLFLIGLIAKKNTK